MDVASSPLGSFGVALHRGIFHESRRQYRNILPLYSRPLNIDINAYTRLNLTFTAGNEWTPEEERASVRIILRAEDKHTDWELLGDPLC